MKQISRVIWKIGSMQVSCMYFSASLSTSFWVYSLLSSTHLVSINSVSKSYFVNTKITGTGTTVNDRGDDSRKRHTHRDQGAAFFSPQILALPPPAHVVHTFPEVFENTAYNAGPPIKGILIIFHYQRTILHVAVP